jgi:hypothetical protein
MAEDRPESGGEAGPLALAPPEAGPSRPVPWLPRRRSRLRDEPRRPAPLLGRPGLDVAVDVLRASLYVTLILWVYYHPGGLVTFVFGGFILADLTSWVVFSFGDMMLRPAGVTLELVAFLVFLGVLSRAGAWEIPIGREGEALAVGFLAYMATFWVKFASHFLRRIAQELEET